MNKAILVIDMPSCCKECSLCVSEELFPSFDEYSCIVENVAVDVYDKPDWCPLKPMPEKIPEFDHTVKAKSDNAYDVGLCMYNKGLNRGYNSCIERILK